MNPVSLIHDMVRDGHITAEQGSLLLELRRMLEWRRRPWWERAAIVVWRVVFEW